MNVTELNNRYRIISTLARGGFGETYIAIDTHMPSKRRCVIKKLHPAVQSDNIPEWLQQRFEREAIVLEELGELNRQIPRLYGYFSEGNDFYLVQELIEGPTLTQKYQKDGNFPEGRVREILISLLSVLEFIHDRRIVHRDVKPDNIILRNSDNLPVLIDFGVIKEALTATAAGGATAYSVALGTPGYMPPEQVSGRPVFSSDLYSLGLTAVFLLTGKSPQYLETDDRTGELLWRKSGEEFLELGTAIDRAIRFHPRDRYASAGEMLKALQLKTPAVSTFPTVVVSPRGLPEKENTPAPPPKPPAKTKKIGSRPPATTVKTGGDNPLGGILLFLFVTVGAFALGYIGFMTILPRSNTQRPRPVPSTEPEPSPEIRVTPVQPERPIFRPTPKPSPVFTPSPTPEAPPSPEPSPSPTPEPSPSPSPEASPSPEPIPIPVPSPETTPAPVPSPIPETNGVKPDGQILIPPSPVPEATPATVPEKTGP